MNYNELRQKYDLPEFEALDFAFEISKVEEENYYIRDIRRHIIEKIRIFVDILEDLIHPNSTVSSYHECKFFDDQEKKTIYDLYGRLMVYIRKSNLLDLEEDDANDAEFIRDIFSSWDGIKKDLRNIIVKLHDCWSKEEISDKTISSYLG